MIRIDTGDKTFQVAYHRARFALPVWELESPRQYARRWREAYRCRVNPSGAKWPHTEYIFDCDADYTWFMLRWG